MTQANKNFNKQNLALYLPPWQKIFSNDRNIKIVAIKKHKNGPLKYVTLHECSIRVKYFLIFNANHSCCRTFHFWRNSFGLRTLFFVTSFCFCFSCFVLFCFVLFVLFFFCFLFLFFIVFFYLWKMALWEVKIEKEKE